MSLDRACQNNELKKKMTLARKLVVEIIQTKIIHPNVYLTLSTRQSAPTLCFHRFHASRSASKRCCLTRSYCILGADHQAKKLQKLVSPLSSSHTHTHTQLPSTPNLPYSFWMVSTAASSLLPLRWSHGCILSYHIPDLLILWEWRQTLTYLRD